VTLARRLATPRGGLVALALGATIAFFAILTTVEQACGECGAPSVGAGAPDLIADAPAPQRPAPADTRDHADAGTAERAGQADSGTSDHPTPADAGPPADAPSSEAAPPKDGGPPADAPSSEAAPSGDSPAQPSPPGAPLAADVSGAANYVRAFYADLAKGDFKAAWPHLAADLRAQHGTLGAWQRGFATTVRQSTSAITAKAAGPSAALVTLTLTAVDRDKCGHEVERHFAVTWRLELADGQWRAPHASARALGKAPTALVATC
jgi:hypothetical protein